ncbi:hypothetical protein ACIF8T_25575 [Streptomyces sp. NPDC085946]|uniref:hypothetical protein n=1 Tax=Streptomyces sp. NPDC085946 TaxID=3365744 RepID=UPI0037D77A90
MTERALDAGATAAWATGHEVYGDNPHLRAAPEKRQLGCVLAVSGTHRLATPAGPRPMTGPALTNRSRSPATRSSACSPPCSFGLPTTSRTDGAGPPGDDATKPAPAAATAAAKSPFSHEDPHLRLEH